MASNKLPVTAEIVATTLAMASECKTQKEIATELAISVSTLQRVLRADDSFRTTYETVLYDASSLLLEELTTIPRTEIDSRRARVICDNIERYLRLRYPKRFGPRIDVTVTTVNLAAAIAAGQARAAAARVVATVPAGAAALPGTS